MIHLSQYFNLKNQFGQSFNDAFGISFNTYSGVGNSSNAYNVFANSSNVYNAFGNSSTSNAYNAFGNVWNGILEEDEEKSEDNLLE